MLVEASSLTCLYIFFPAAPEEPYPTIPECANRREENETEDGEDGDNSCVLKQEAGKSLNLTCEVHGFRPMVDLVWTNGTLNVNDVFRTLANKSDGTQSLSARFEVTASLERQTFYCNVSGESVQGQERSSMVTIEGYRGIWLFASLRRTNSTTLQMYRSEYLVF